MLSWIVFACFLYQLIRWINSLRSSRLLLPPGPKGLPFIGNSWDIPKEFPWIAYHNWCKEFNTDVLHLNLSGTPLIVLDSYEAANDLLDKRSSTFSDRPQFTMTNELMGLDFNFAFMEYGSKWQKHRRLMHQHFHAGASRAFRPQSLKASRNLLNRFLDIPDDVIGNLKHMAGETIMKTTYGIQVKDHDDPYVETADKAVHKVLEAAVPGKYLVDILPFLKYIPEWVPGAGFKSVAKEIKLLNRNMLTLPYAAAKRNIETGVYSPSFVSFSLEHLDNSDDETYFDEEMIQNDAATMYGAASDTTVSALASCILGLIENPEVVKRAQEELDRVVKPGQLPEFEDEASLPYITAITKESLRWRDVVPTAVARKLLADEQYNGYCLPAGSIVIPNAWAILHDEARYPDPFKFNPDRFITKDGKVDDTVFDPEHACWGFGRRICPGRHMAFYAMWITIASILAVFDIKKAVDEEGNVIELSHEYLSGNVCTPKPYKCSIVPRSEAAERLIRAHANSETTD